MCKSLKTLIFKEHEQIIVHVHFLFYWMNIYVY